MLKKILILALFFYFLALGQTSFFVHFNIMSEIPFILISVILLNLLEKTKDYSGIFAGFIAGLFLDIFSSGIIGFYALIFSTAAILIKIILRKYVCPVIRLGTRSYDRVGPDFYGKISKK